MTRYKVNKLMINTAQEKRSIFSNTFVGIIICKILNYCIVYLNLILYYNIISQLYFSFKNWLLAIKYQSIHINSDFEKSKEIIGKKKIQKNLNNEQVMTIM